MSKNLVSILSFGLLGLFVVQCFRDADFVSAGESRPLWRYARGRRVRHRLSPQRLWLLHSQRLLCRAAPFTGLSDAHWCMPLSL